jgi:hypothetical protein
VVLSWEFPTEYPEVDRAVTLVPSTSVPAGSPWSGISNAPNSWEIDVPLAFGPNRKIVMRGRMPAVCHDCCRIRRGLTARLALVLVLVGAPCFVSAQSSVSAEYRTKASFLAKFPSFIDWPESAFSSAEAPFLICVVGDFRFGTALAEFARNTLPHGRRVDVRWPRKDAELRNCQILFVSNSEVSRYIKILQIVQGAGILTVGETADFLVRGGMMSFSFQHEALQFEVDLGAANKAHLRVSSRLLALAHRVVNNPESSNHGATAEVTVQEVK